MIKKIKFSQKENFPSLVGNLLQEEGVVIVEDWITELDLEALKFEVEGEIKEIGEDYNFGRSYRSEFQRHLDKGNKISTFFSQEWMKTLFYSYTGINKSLPDDIFATHDFIETDDLARNGFLHFDRHHCFKFFLYLTDIREESGAFYCCPKSHTKGRELRLNSWKEDSNYHGVKNRIEIDFPELLENLNVCPVEGKAGTLIIFDTDAFHKGGIIKNSNERIIVRSHWKVK